MGLGGGGRQQRGLGRGVAARDARRRIQLLRDAGALGQVPGTLSALGVATAKTGDFIGASAIVAESKSVAAATGSPLGPYTALRIAALRGREAEAIPDTKAIEQAVAIGRAARSAEPMARQRCCTTASVGMRMRHPPLGSPPLSAATIRRPASACRSSSRQRLGAVISDEQQRPSSDWPR